MRLRKPILRPMPLKVPVSPTFSGLRIGDGKRAPEGLRGRVIPWMQVYWLRGLEAGFTDEHASPILHADRRIAGAFDSERALKLARRLLEREVRWRLSSGALVLERHRQPEGLCTRLFSITVMLAIVAALAISLPFMLADHLEELDTFESVAARLAMGFFSIASLITMPLMFLLMFFFAWREDRRIPLDLVICSDGMTAVLPSGRRIDQRWQNVQRIESCTVTFNDRTQARLSRDARLTALRTVLSRDVVRKIDRPASRLFRIFAITSVVMLPVGVVPLVALYHTGYLLKTDFLRITLVFLAMLVALSMGAGVAAVREKRRLPRRR